MQRFEENLSQWKMKREKPRNFGLTVVMDKGLSAVEAQNLVSSAGPFVDYVKLGFGTMAAQLQFKGTAKDLRKKIEVYHQAGIKVFPGGTLFEWGVPRALPESYIDFLKEYQLDTVEVSDGILEIPHDMKCHFIQRYAKEGLRVFSEVGYKNPAKKISSKKWIELMRKELGCGAWKVVAEARESGTVGIYDKQGRADERLIKEVAEKIGEANIIWEAPQKSQQAFLIKIFSRQANLGNIPPSEVVSLEAMRIGLRAETFEPPVGFPGFKKH